MSNSAETYDIWLLIKQVIERAKPLIKKSFGADVVVTHYDNLADDGRDHHFILRLFLRGVECPDTVVLKYHARWGKVLWDNQSKDSHRLANDYAGCYFLSQYGHKPPFSPKAYQVDFAQNLMLIEDLKDVEQNYVDVLLDNERTLATERLSRFMPYLAQMHGQTSQRIRTYIDFRNALDFRNARDHELMVTTLSKIIPNLKDALNAINFSVDDGFWVEYQQLLDIIRDPGDFMGYVHGDMCPDNILWVNDNPQLIDFELGGAGLVLLDAVYPRMMFPTCWCVGQIDLRLVEELEAVYRAELIKYIAAAADDFQWQKYLTAACGFWVIYTLVLKLIWTGDLDSDSEWGISTQHKRIVSRLRAFINISPECEQWPHLYNTFTALHSHLMTRWEDSSSEGLQLYPAMIVAGHE